MGKLSRRNLILFAGCNFGWSLAFYNVNNLLNYFYIPNNEGGGAMFPLFIPKNKALLGLTILGLIVAFGRIIDAVSDPVIANISDRRSNRFGKRRFFMLISSFPLALFGLLAFMPPIQETNILNGLYLMVILLGFYLAMTTYVVPCSALVGELGYTKTDRLNLSTFSSVGWALGFAFGNTIYLFQSTFEGIGYTSVRSFQISVMIFSLLSFITLFFSAFFIQERPDIPASNTPVFRSLISSLGNSNLRLFLISEVAYWFAMTFIQTGISYYIVTLLGLDKSFATTAMMSLFVVSFMFYVPVNLLARRIGKKRMELIGFVVLAIAYSFVQLMGRVPIAPEVQIMIVALTASLPMAIFGIMPFAIISDIADKDAQETGDNKIGVFYALRGFFMKVGTSFAGLIFPSIILWGGTDLSDFGIRMTGVFGVVFCLIGFGFMIRFKDYYHDSSLIVEGSKS